MAHTVRVAICTVHSVQHAKCLHIFHQLNPLSWVRVWWQTCMNILLDRAVYLSKPQGHDGHSGIRAIPVSLGSFMPLQWYDKVRWNADGVSMGSGQKLQKGVPGPGAQVSGPFVGTQECAGAPFFGRGLN